MIEAAIRTHLIGDAGLAALVAARVYPVQLPQRPTLPALTYQRISTVPTQTRGEAAANHERTRFQIDCWAADYDSMLAVRTALGAALGTLAQAANPRIDVALKQNGREGLDTASGRWRATVDYFIWHEV